MACEENQWQIKNGCESSTESSDLLINKDEESVARKRHRSTGSLSDGSIRNEASPKKAKIQVMKLIK